MAHWLGALRGTYRVQPAADLQDFAHFLVVLGGNDPGRRVLLGATPITVGRDGAHELVLEDSRVSRAHLRVSVAGSRVLIEDLNSTNGTFVCGRRIKGVVHIAEGTLVELGRHILKVERRSKLLYKVLSCVDS